MFNFAVDKPLLLRKRIAILLLGLMLFTNLEFYQFVKLPVLFEHFQEHKAGNHEMTFFEFWHIHYADGQHKDADFSRDLQLPFQTSNVVQVINSSGFILPQICIVPCSMESIQVQPNTYYPGFIPETCPFDIFQPPRIL